MAGGQLVVDSSNIPNIEGMKDGIDNWVRKFNDTMKANGKRLDGLTVRGNKVVLTKVAVAATAGTSTVPPSSSTPAAPPPQSGTSPQSGTTTPPPTTPPAEPEKVGKGCIAALLSGLILVGAGVGVWAVTRDDGDGKVSTAPPPSSSTSSTSTTTTTTAPAPTLPPVAAIVCPSTLQQGDYWTEFGDFDERRCNALPPEGYFPGPGTGPFPPLIVFDPTVGILHTLSGPDAVTGRTGPSQALFPFQIYWDAEGTITVASDCGGDVATGQAPPFPVCRSWCRSPCSTSAPAM